MTRLILVGGLFLVAAAAGCSTCCTPFDAAYPTYGGKWERTDRFHGRVGSAFAPAGPEPGALMEEVPTPAEMPTAPMSDEMLPDLPPDTLPDDDAPQSFDSPDLSDQG